MTTDDFHIISTIRYDPALLNFPQNTGLSGLPGCNLPFYMLLFHRDRMIAATQAFSWTEAETSLSGDLGLTNLDAILRKHLSEKYSERERENPIRIRIELAPTDALSFTSAHQTPCPLESFFPESLSAPNTLSPLPSTWTIHLHPTPIKPSFFTVHKTTARAHYDAVRSASGSPLPPTTELLLQNEQGEVMEGTLTTPYFWRGERWVTPRAEAGGNRGTTRRWALEGGLAVEGEVRAETVEQGEMVWLSNGVRGWGWGVVSEEGGS